MMNNNPVCVCGGQRFPLGYGACKDCQQDTCVHIGHRIDSSYEGMASYYFLCTFCFEKRENDRLEKIKSKQKRRAYLREWGRNIELSKNFDLASLHILLPMMIEEIIDNE